MSVEKGFYPDAVKFICCIIFQIGDSIKSQHIVLYHTDYEKYVKLEFTESDGAFCLARKIIKKKSFRLDMCCYLFTEQRLKHFI